MLAEWPLRRQSGHGDNLVTELVASLGEGTGWVTYGDCCCIIPGAQVRRHGMSFDPTRLCATEALPLLRSGELTAEALARACLDRIAVRDQSVHAWSFHDADAIVARACEMDRTGLTGLLSGLPIGVKDVILTEEMPTQYNSPLYENFHPRINAACVRILQAAGGLIFGKTHTVEFAATGRKAPTRNPRDLERTPGGS